MPHTGMKPGAALTPRIPDESVCSTLLTQIPPQVAAHSRAVQRLALEMCDALAAHGVRLNRALLSAAALLHDICRTEPNHAFAGAQKLRGLGYPEIADIVAVHHDWSGGPFDESALLYLADKYVQGDQRVTLEERFERSRAKCRTEQALCAHDRRYRAALAARQQYDLLIGEKQP